MDYIQALEWIHSHKRFAPTPTLDRIRRLMTLLGNPQKALSFVHVAGTNGKGSTSAMTASVLREAGYRTGLTVSPYIVDFRERMQINGTMISQETLAELANEVAPVAQQVEYLTEFELVTALAFLWFARENCEIVVAEVGLGGRFDATNVMEPPLACVITKIGLDHTEILGDTVEQIAREKAEIIKPGTGRVIIAPNQPEDARNVFRMRCQETGCPLTIARVEDAQLLSMALCGETLLYRGERLSIPLAGAHQVENALTAVEVCLHLAKTGMPNIMNALVSGLAKTRFPARLEVLGQNPLVIVDGAHNPDGAAVLSNALPLLGKIPLIAIFGMAADKDTEKVAALLAPAFTEILCVPPDTPRAMASTDLAQLCTPYCATVSTYTEIGLACAAGLAKAKQAGGALVVCGSLYLAAPAREWFLQQEGGFS